MDKLALINRALNVLGEPPITSVDQPHTKGGRVMVTSYDATRKEILRKYPWNFAESWTSVNKTTAPSFYYSDAYTLPADFLRLLIVGDFDRPATEYRLLYQGAPDFRRVIALNNGGAPTLTIAYQCDIDQLSIWDPLALKVFALSLAVDNAKAITGQDALVKLANDLLAEEIKDAVGVDGQEQSIQQYRFSRVQEERDRGSFGVGFTNVQGYN